MDKNAKIEMFFIEVAIKKTNDEPQIITISKEDMLKVPSELKQSELNNDHGDDKENEDNDESGASKTDTCKENDGVTEPLLPNVTGNATTPGRNNAAHTQRTKHVLCFSSNLSKS